MPEAVACVLWPDLGTMGGSTYLFVPDLGAMGGSTYLFVPDLGTMGGGSTYLFVPDLGTMGGTVYLFVPDLGTIWGSVYLFVPDLGTMGGSVYLFVPDLGCNGSRVSGIRTMHGRLAWHQVVCRMYALACPEHKVGDGGMEVDPLFRVKEEWRSTLAPAGAAAYSPEAAGEDDGCMAAWVLAVDPLATGCSPEAAGEDESCLGDGG